MGDQRSIREAFASASEFLSPVLQRDELQRSCGQSLIDILSQNTPEYSAEDGSARADVIGKALGLLSQIHVAFVNPVIDEEQSSQANAEEEDAALEDAKRRRILHALLDLIALEGIYPSLSFGVGIPLQQRVISVLPAGVIAQQNPPPPEKPPDISLLGRILTGLSGIIFDVRPSIQPVITGRILSDIISASSDLGYNPILPASKEQTQYRQILAKVVEKTPSASLLPTLSAFLQSNPAQWFKSVITGLLSRVPLRSNGVLQTIVFLASQFAPSLGRETQEQGPSGLRITVNAIMHASRLLSAVPHGMEASAYFKVIGPQLLTLIDGDDPDLRKAAAYIIGNGILGKKAYGAPGTIGHLIFLDPIFKALTGTADASSRCYLMPPERTQRQESNQILSSEAEIILAINRLKALVLQPPNPGLVKRVVYPVLLPLWGFACFSAQQQLKSIHDDVMIVLQTYFGVSAGFPPLKKIVDNFLWTGGPTCAYASDSQNGILLKKPKGAGIGSNMIALVDDLQSRAKLFMSLLNADPSHDERTSEVFLYVTETWLTQPANNNRTLDKIQLLADNGGSDGIIQNLISAKLAETLLDTFRDTLSRRPLKVLQLIKQILDGELSQVNTHQNTTSPGSTKVSLSSLANIVPSEQVESNEASANDSAESLQVVFSLLSTILASPEFSISKETGDLLAAIKETLDQLLPHLPPSLSRSGTTASMLLEIQLDSPENQESKGKSVEIPDFEIHRRALMNLNSELPPVQAEGFSLLSDLVKRSSPILDIPSTLTLLLSIITDSSEAAANDEFIYLNAIKLIGTLASRHPRTVTTTLIERYIDRSENATLDQRLKVGEALLRTIQDLGEALVGETAKVLGEGLISVAGRRASKPQAQKSRKQALEQQRRKMEREERQRQKDASSGWRLSTPKIAEQILDNDDSDSETPEQAVHSANIISAWAAGSTRDEEPDDLRVRASALSILATAVQTNITGLGPSILASCVDLALATLTLEPEDECAILRRASAVLLLNILKALDETREKRKTQDIGIGFTLADESSHVLRQDVARRGPSTIGNIPFMLRTLAGVEAREKDPISLEAWIEKSLLWGVGQYAGNGSEEDQPRLELGDKIAGLRINPLAGRRGGHAERPKIEEIE
ncbi:RTP1-C1 domain-containing protein [Aspergillus foveolatus]|uniref:RTP1-C1 domain-containing protein n=1 Tax=Aspergillus foveolatus TaxID=210207 RepID=UPI003CCC963C